MRDLYDQRYKDVKNKFINKILGMTKTFVKTILNVLHLFHSSILYLLSRLKLFVRGGRILRDGEFSCGKGGLTLGGMGRGGTVSHG